MARLSEELTHRLTRLAESEGIELLAVEIAGTARHPLVRLVIDRENGGVGLADCEGVSRQASTLFDAYDPFPGAYTLEVTSPGLDRKFYSDKDFVRFAGQMVRVRMRPNWPSPRAFTGVLVEYIDNTVRVRDQRETVRELPMSGVFEVRLAPFLEPNGGPTSGKKQGRKSRT
jgi:ribosome maturation factor RimP